MKHKLLSLFALAGMAVVSSAAYASGALLGLQNLSSPTVYSPGNATSASYTLTIYNNGGIDPAAALQDVAPAGVTITEWSATTAGCSPASGGAGTLNTTCSVPANGSVSVAVFAQIAASATGTITNTATVTPSTGNACAGPGSCSSSASIAATASAAKLALTKTASISTYPTGTNTYFTYTLRVTNQASVAATGAQLLDDAPAYIGFVSWQCTDGQTGAGNLRVNGFPLTLIVPANGTVICTVDAVTQTGASGTLTNTATLTPSFQDQCAGAGACTGSASIASTAPAVVPQFSVTKTASISQYTVGSSTALSYGIVVSNSAAAAGATTVTDSAPAGASFSSWSCPAGSPSTGSGSLSSTLSVPASGSATCSVNAIIASNSTGTVVNTATINPTSPAKCTPCSANASVSAVQPVTPAASLAFSNTPSINAYTRGAGTSLMYTLRVDNNSGTASQPAHVTDTAPIGVTFNSWTANGCTPSSGNGNVSTSCVLSANGTLTVVVSASIASTATASITNTATLEPGGNDNCGRPTCTASATITASAAVLATSSVSLSSSANPSSQGAAVTFTATVIGSAPSGPVAFASNGQTLCSAATLTASTAVCTTSSLSTGTDTITASYSGDSGNKPSQATLTQTVTPASTISATTTTLTSNLNPTALGQAVELTAIVAGSAPTGSITFKDGATVLCSGAGLRTIGAVQQALCVATFDTTGVHSLIATYSGDGKNVSSNGSLAVTVTPTVAFNPNQFGLTGSWYNAATSGQGVLLEVAPDFIKTGEGIIFGGWFAYDTTANGGQRWYTLQGEVETDNPVATMGIFQAVGGNFNAGTNSAFAVGSATLTFADCTHGTLRYSFTDGSGRQGTIPLTRLSVSANCTASGTGVPSGGDYYLSGTWFDPATSGQGFLFDISPSQTTLFGAWFTYALDGSAIGGGASQRWFTIQANNYVPGTRAIVNVPIYSTTGGVFDDPAAVTTPQVGTADISFSSCSSMTVKYQFTGGDLSGATGTIALSPTGPVPNGCE